MNPKEPRLIQAILDDDFELVEQLGKERSLQKETNWLGFNPIEIAQFLDKENSLDILIPGRQKRRIAVHGQGKIDKDSFEGLFGVHYLSHPKFPNYQAFVSAIQKSGWLYRKGPFGKKMRWLADIFSLELFAGLVAHVEIRWIDDVLGYGLFALEDLEPNTFIGEYTGEVGPLDAVSGPENPYLLRYPRPMLSFNFLQIGAERMGNETRFINHSDKPNLKTGIACDRGLFRSIFVARHRIPKGAQLTFNYGKKFWRHHGRPVAI